PVDVSLWPAIDAYARAFALAYGGVIGGDGSQALLELFLSRGVIAYRHQVGGWGPSVSDVCPLYQPLPPTGRADLPGAGDADGGVFAYGDAAANFKGSLVGTFNPSTLPPEG